MNLQPHYIRVTHAGREATLAHYQLGQGEQRILVIAGTHGREHGGIQAAYELLDRLAGVSLHGQVDVLPVCNPLAYAAETRFTPGSDRDMARSFTLEKPSDLTEALCQVIIGLAEEAEVVLSLHSAGEARYLPHVIFYREQDIEWVTLLGFPFAINRNTPQMMTRRIFSYLRPEQRGVTLELGGGIVAFPEDVALGVDLIMAYLGRSGFLESGDYEREPTPRKMVWLTDARLLVYAPGEGAFYAHTHRARLGADFIEGEPFGSWVGLDDLRPYPLVAPVMGKLVYLRTRNRVHPGGTLAMFLPL